MVRTYVRKRPSISEESLQNTLRDVANGMSQRKASEIHKIPQQTLSDKIKKRHPSSVGRSTALSPFVEQEIVKVLESLTNWGFPFCPSYFHVYLPKLPPY